MGVEIRGCCPLLQVFDMPRSVAFYGEGLGYRIKADSGRGADSGWVLLDRDGSELMLNTAYDQGERPATPDPARVAAHGDTCIYFGCEDLDGLYADLLGKGLTPLKPRVAPYGMKQLYLTDPDGYGLCFQWPASPESS